MKKLLFLVAEDSYFFSHRLNLGKAAIKAGFEVALATRCSTLEKPISATGIQVFPLKHFTRTGLNPIKQILSLWELYTIYKAFKPDIVHHVALKPIIYGSLIARLLSVPRIINALGGLGYLFTEGAESLSKIIDIKKSQFQKLFCFSLRSCLSKKNSTLILQNKDDLETLTKLKCVKPNQGVIIPGAGVDISAFPLVFFPSFPPIIIMCISRMLWDKGIRELVQAAEILQEKKCAAEVWIYGMPDPENPSSISLEQLRAWHDSRLITWKGHCENVASAYANCHIAALPSYREGLPKSLLEAASCGRPIVTTDVPGCREVVKDGENGLLVPVKDSKELASALMILCENEALRTRMGLAGHKRVEQYFSDQIIHQQTIHLYNEVR